MPSHLLRMRENVVERLRAKFAATNVGHVPHTEFLGDFRGTRFVSKEKNITVGMQLYPTADGVSLNNAIMTLERLRSSENRQHIFSGTGRPAMQARWFGASNFSQFSQTNLRRNV